MRDLGLMGENVFSLWCAEVGLIPNGSKIDKTGWDYFVEFPFDSSKDPSEIHKSAIECKIQVKAKGRNRRKPSIKLSNLRRLITAQMPAFFVIIEFDDMNHAQRAFVVHVDNSLISKVLKRLHEIEPSDKPNHNKREMTIHYDDSNMMSNLDGKCLKKMLLHHIGNSMSEYVQKKKEYLESTGFEDGFSQITFTTKGEDNLKKLIDVSIGVEKSVDISSFEGTQTRFGITRKSPFASEDGGKLEMPNLKPTAEGMIRFREDKLSPGLSFKARLYNSPFNAIIPDELKKIRVEGDFFDLVFNPHTGSANYSFSFGEGVRLEVRKYRDAIRLISLLSSTENTIYVELIFKDFPKLEFLAKCDNHSFSFHKELEALNAAAKILSEFDVTDPVNISFGEISKFRTEISQMENLISSSPNRIKIEFSVDDREFDPSKKIACIFLATTPIGSHIFGVIIVVRGAADEVKGGRFRLVTEDVAIEKKIISEKDESFNNDDLISALEIVKNKYNDNCSVVTMY